MNKSWDKLNDIKFSSKVVVVDKQWNVYLEKCPALQWKLWLFWWKKKENETPKETAIRELSESEELWIKVWKKDLRVVEVNWPMKFQTWVFYATIFILHISAEVAEIIKKKENVEVWKLEDFRKKVNGTFIFEKKAFLDMIERALNYDY